ASEEWRTTAFGHYLIEAFRGGSDETGPVDANGDGRIDALEVHDYVSRNVERWARGNRDAVQTPVLLPRGQEGERRARAMSLTMVPPNPGYTAARAPDFTPPDELREGWDKYEKVAQQTPSPAVYTPHLWRQYEATLIRAEQLARAGDQDNARFLLGNQLPALEKEIREAQGLRLDSLENTLAMRWLANLGGQSAKTQQALNELWSAQPSEFRETWPRVLKRSGETDRGETRLRLGLIEGVLDKAAENPGEWDKADALLQVLADPATPPAEVLLLEMLRRYRAAPEEPPAQELVPRLRLALACVQQAEKTALAVRGSGHPYSEQVYAWIADQVLQADRVRCAGQDRLFASRNSAWDDAEVSLKEAQKRYETAAKNALSVQKALDVRDRLTAELP